MHSFKSAQTVAPKLLMMLCCHAIMLFESSFSSRVFNCSSTIHKSTPHCATDSTAATGKIKRGKEHVLWGLPLTAGGFLTPHGHLLFAALRISEFIIIFFTKYDTTESHCDMKLIIVNFVAIFCECVSAALKKLTTTRMKLLHSCTYNNI